MNPIPISLDDYVLSGGGANGESYFHKENPSVMLKLYFPGKVSQPLDELRISRKVFEAGIPTPEPGDFVITEDGRYGIRFHRILDKVSYARAVGDNPGKVEEYAGEFARMCLSLHRTHVDTSQFENVKDHYFRLLEESPFFKASEKDRIGRFIADTPDTDTAVHGDLQFGNAIFAGDKRYFIDLGDFGYGNPLFDLGMVLLCCKITDAAFIEEAFHMPKSLAIEFWDHFVPAYFGKGIPPREVEESILPYSGLKTLIIERDTGMPMPIFRDALRSIL